MQQEVNHRYALEERIRELEEMNAELRMTMVNDLTAMTLIKDALTERIAKAKAILEGFRVTEFGKVATPVIDDALEALEGND